MRAPREERGAVAVITCLLMVPLVGMGALVIDVGQLVQERRELQNGADASALAVAKDCGSGDCLAFEDTADAYADLNADDEDSNIDEVCGDSPGLPACEDPPEVPEDVDGYVKVVDSTQEVSSGTNQITYTLAQVLGFTGDTVHASAVAAWGSIGGATTLPITFSTCDFDQNDVQTGEPPYSGTPQTIFFHDAKGTPLCPGIGPSGADAPGGFGWLAEDDCEADLETGGWADNKTGAAVPAGCDPAEWQNQTLLIPIYDELNGETGTNLEYRIEKFAAFYLVGYRFPSNSFGTNCQPSQTCLVGFFRGYVFPGEFGGEDTGAVAVKMIG